MEVEVYADLLCIINAGMDGLCLGLTGRLLHRRLVPWRLLLASLLGGIYAVAVLFWDIGQAPALAADLLVCLLLCLLALGSRGWGRRGGFFLAVGVYFLISLVMGGIMTGLYHLLNRMGAPSLLPEGQEGAEAWLFGVIALVGGILTMGGGRLLRRSASVRVCRVTVELDGRRAELAGILDTGNLLRDPMGGRAVICVHAPSISLILSPGLASLGLETHPNLQELTDEEARRVRVIPADTATGKGLLYGICPDVVTLTDPETKRSATVDAIVALTRLHGTEALVPAELL